MPFIKTRHFSISESKYDPNVDQNQTVFKETADWLEWSSCTAQSLSESIVLFQQTGTLITDRIHKFGIIVGRDAAMYSILALGSSILPTHQVSYLK